MVLWITELCDRASSDSDHLHMRIICTFVQHCLTAVFDISISSKQLFVKNGILLHPSTSFHYSMISIK